MKHTMLSLIIFGFLSGQTEPLTDIMEVEPRIYGFKNATIHVSPDKTIENGSLLIRDGIIEAIGKKVSFPDDAPVRDMESAHIYAGFIDGWVEVSTEDYPKTNRTHWINLVHPEWNAADAFAMDEGTKSTLHELGFTQIHAVLDDGIFRGQSSLISLDESNTILNPALCQVMDFKVRGWGGKDYPSALLGTIAVMRQTLYDADWYSKATDIAEAYPDKNEPVKNNPSLELLSQARETGIPFLFKTTNETAAGRAMAIAKKFNLDLWLLGSGFEYRRLRDIQKQNPFVILNVRGPRLHISG